MNLHALHWAPVEILGAGHYALWPTPVNSDVCFDAAGVTEFGDIDAEGEAVFTAMLERLLEALDGTFGPPRLLGTPLRPRRPWVRRLVGAVAAPYPLCEQLEQPMHDDNLPDAVVVFGNDTARLRSGQGHVLLWLTLPWETPDVERLLARIAAPVRLVRTPLDWAPLLPGRRG